MKTKKSFQEIIRSPLMIIGSVGILCLFVFIMMAKRVEAARQEFYTVQDQLKLYRSEIWYLEKLDRAKLEKQLVKELDRFPSANEITFLINEISEIAKNAGIEFETISPKDMTQSGTASDPIESMFNQVPIEMRLHGTYENVATFLSALRELDHGVVRLGQFEMSQNTNKPEINLTLVAVAFVKKTSDQQVLGKDSVKVPDLKREPRKSRSNSSSIVRNPFTQAKDSEKPAINIEGIIYDPKTPLALIDGEVRRVGDQVNGMTLVEIKSDLVVLEQKDHKTRIQIKPGIRK